MEVEPWLATDYEFTDDNTVKITLRDGVKFSSGRTMDGEAVKECLEDLIANHDRAPYDMKIDKIEADGMTVTIHTSEPCPALINYLGDPYGAIIDMDYGVQGEGGSANVAGTGPYVATEVSPTEIKLVKNDDYWGGDVKVDNVIVPWLAYSCLRYDRRQYVGTDQFIWDDIIELKFWQRKNHGRRSGKEFCNLSQNH